MKTIKDIKRDFSHIRSLVISGGLRVNVQTFLSIAKNLDSDCALGKPLDIDELLEPVKSL